jgi:hypothetical protein
MYGFHQVWYQGIVKATGSGVLEDLTFKISEGSDQSCPESKYPVGCLLSSSKGKIVTVTFFLASLAPKK